MVDPEILCDELSNSFSEYDFNKTDNGDVVCKQSVPAGMYHKPDYESFVEDIKEFIMYHTEDWIVQSSSMNDIEGVGTVVLAKNADTSQTHPTGDSQYPKDQYEDWG